MRKIILLLTIVLVGCAPKGTVKFVSFDSISPMEITGTGMDVDAVVTIDNSFKRKIKITEASFNVISDNQIVANISLREPLSITQSITTEYTIPLRIRLSIAAITQANKILKDPKSLRIEGSLKGQMSIIKRKLNFNYTLTEKDKKEIIQQIRKQLTI